MPCAALAASATPPPRNPFLIDGPVQMTHIEPAQQDSLPIPGPTGFHDVRPEQIRRLPSGFGNGMALSGPRYADGVEVVWAINAGRVAKLRVDGGRFEELARYEFPGEGGIDAARAERITAALDAAPDEAALVGFVRAEHPYWLERIAARTGVYTLMDRDGLFYTVVRDRIVVLGDRDRGDPRSPIELKREWRIPSSILSDWRLRWWALGRWWRGELPVRPAGERPTLAQMVEILHDAGIGLGMTWDGHLVLTSISGAVAVVDREFRAPPSVVRLAGEAITNSFAVDDAGGIYVVTDHAMHKLVWTGSRLSSDAADGAWREPYERSSAPLGGIRAGSGGSGSTPTLMGFGPDEDHLVVITDGAEVMNLVAYWRDAVPPGATRRADQIRVTVGVEQPAAVQSEQSVVVWEEGAFVVNNVGPDTLPSALENVVAIGVTRAPPRGVERFRWDRAAHRWQRVWARSDVASPSCVPVMSGVTRQVYLQSAEAGRFEILGLDWDSGATRTRLRLPPSQAYNGAYMLVQFLADGDIAMGMLTGPVRIRLAPP
ncbi:MAG: hypothetical protein SF182_04430 [Deltaproteobacteria bacterium]|nr:hypothetical protein [Deltaproteobacteria bacterium]